MCKQGDSERLREKAQYPDSRAKTSGLALRWLARCVNDAGQRGVQNWSIIGLIISVMCKKNVH